MTRIFDPLFRRVPTDGARSLLRRLLAPGAAVLCGMLVAGLAGSARAAAQMSTLEMSGLTFIGSRGEGGELVLRAKTALFEPATQEADLYEVRVVVGDESRGRRFTMSCDRAKLNLETNDFFAEGNVNGAGEGGERYATPWVRYSDAQGLLYTDAPVQVVDEGGSLRGDGFRFFVSERRFQLIGNVRVDQTP